MFLAALLLGALFTLARIGLSRNRGHAAERSTRPGVETLALAWFPAGFLF